MSSFATKLIVLAVIVGALVALVKFGSSAKDAVDEAQNPEKTFSEQTAEDDARLRALPDDVAKEDEKPAEKVVEEPKAVAQAEVEKADSTTKRLITVLETRKKEVEVVRVFKKLDEIGTFDAEKLFETALANRKIGRLPGTGYKLTVDCCRQIIQKYPGTEYDYKAKRLMADIPARFTERYKITDEEKDYESVGVVSKK